MNALGGGRTSMGELASGVQLRFGPLRVDAAAGLAYPLGTQLASPWPEGKIETTYTPHPVVELKAIVGRKGSLPTIREQYQLGTGNPMLGAEMATYAEGSIALHPVPWITVRGRAYVRDTTGLIKFDMATGVLENVGNVTFRGGDATVDVQPRAIPVGGGATWVYLNDSMPGNPVPFDFEPRHRVDAYASYHFRSRAGGVVRFRYVGSRMDQGTELPGYATLDTSAWVRLSKDLRATLRVDNITDDRYEIRAIGVYSVGRLFLLSVDGVWQ
jgi:outer membrane receptor protein involved in Fe transport